MICFWALAGSGVDCVRSLMVSGGTKSACGLARRCFFTSAPFGVNLFNHSGERWARASPHTHTQTHTSLILLTRSPSRHLPISSRLSPSEPFLLSQLKPEDEQQQEWRRRVIPLWKGFSWLAFFPLLINDEQMRRLLVAGFSNEAETTRKCFKKKKNHTQDLGSA